MNHRPRREHTQPEQHKLNSIKEKALPQYITRVYYEQT
ncbi:hypothetical protein CSOJ01_15964 [Colletotrichum sojae]|uniref:Uncharacterized protein n=1 Tax=Colletotrichum sojae TaxID=2175907 RepID=A0A8H6IL30_9PEZI|nr:hypothetical protein CSOJ01_15964 [Colletotrichum sojae]